MVTDLIGDAVLHQASTKGEGREAEHTAIVVLEVDLRRRFIAISSRPCTLRYVASERRETAESPESKTLGECVVIDVPTWASLAACLDQRDQQCRGFNSPYCDWPE